MSLNTSNLIHIVAEVVTLLAITTYFLHQNRKMNDLIDSLTERLEEQEEKIEKHDKVISDILKTLKSNDKPTPSPQCVGDKCVMPTPPYASMLNSVFLDNPFPQFFAQPSTTTSSSIVEEADSEVEEKELDEEEEEQPQQEIVVDEEEEDPQPIPLPPLELVEPEPKVVEIKDEPVTTESSKKKKKKKKKANSVTDIDKELEDELNDLYKEEIMRNNS
jgi:hypothetical protein